ncbi:MAG: hypothetical protein JNL49_01410 [Bacteroidia bacterium]|nr:hypothetical protein [Bacteroidia bacterium]
MKKHLLMSIMLFLIAENLSAQKYNLEELRQSIPKVSALADSMVSYIDTVEAKTNKALASDRYQDGKRLFLSPLVKDIYYGKQVAKINTGKEHIYEGTAITLKNASNETKTNLNFTLRTEDWLYLGFGIEAGASESVAVLFNNGDLKPGVTYIGSFSITPSKFSSIKSKRTKEEISKLETKRKSYFKTQQLYYSKYYKLKYLDLYQKFKEADSIAKFDETYIKGIDEQTKLSSLIDEFQLREKNREIRNKLKNKFANDLYDLEINQEVVSSIRLGWISGNIKYSKVKFATFNDNYYFYEKLGTRIFEKWEFSLAYNQVYKNLDRSLCILNRYYFAIGANLRKKNDYEIADKKDYTLAINEGGSTDSTLVYEEKKNLIDITNKPFNSTWEFQPYISFLTPISKSEVVSLGFGITAYYRQESLPTYEPKVSLVFNVQEEESSKSKVNFELFVKVDDVFNVYKERNLAQNRATFSKRAVFGINTVIPLSKVFLN